ncbi:MAG: acyl-CoA reductase-like NAD-dependent aldehyde dehydrogenase [Chlamydiales bacterium]|jgi:acyl-CoA reductase-like NAD-dependent aldehyde dehydrogenase
MTTSSSTQTRAAHFADINPATGEKLADISVATAAEVTQAVAAAQEASAAWRALDLDARCELLAQVAAGIADHADEFADLITREMGKPRAEALKEAEGYAAHALEILAEVKLALAPQAFESRAADTVLVREAHGVVAAITPWNFPVGMPVTILFPALATGNTVVFKPSEHVPLCGALLARLFQKALPQGVLALIQGAGDVGAQLVAAEVDMIGFVGSRATGQHIMASASEGLKRLVLELGGKDPLIVFEDADLDAAAECVARHSLRNTGQVCCSIERVYVAESIAADFEERVVEQARQWTHGDGFDESVRMGPMVSGEQRAKVSVQVDGAVRDGARLLLGGHEDAGDGFFYPATVLAGVQTEMQLSSDETFGPVVSLTTFSGDEQEAIRLANDTPYGLGANVWTADRERGQRVARGLRAGQVGVNRYLTAGSGTPWVGARQSGFGFLGGIEGHRQFTVPKTISTAIPASSGA